VFILGVLAQVVDVPEEEDILRFVLRFEELPDVDEDVGYGLRGS